MSVEFLGGIRTGAGGQPLPFSPAVKAGPFVFVSGQVAMGDNGEIVPGGIEAQTRQTLKNVEKALALAGCTLKDVVKSTVWLRRRARLLDVQSRLRRILSREQTGAIDDAGDADDRRQGRDRSRRLPRLANRLRSETVTSCKVPAVRQLDRGLAGQEDDECDESRAEYLGIDGGAHSFL